MVGNPPLNREQGFCIIFPRLARIDLLLADIEHLIQGICHVGMKLTPPVSDQSFRGSVATNGINQYRKKVPLVLRWRNGGREDRTREIFKNGNDIYWARIRKQVFFDISDIGAPILMASHRLEWHLEFGTRLSLMCLQAVELPVRCHDAATGRIMAANRQLYGLETHQREPRRSEEHTSEL